VSTHLKQKSACNIDSAKQLINQSLYPSSIHCSYYSCVQLMLHLLRSHFGHHDTDINELLYPPEQKNKQLHVNLIRIFRGELKEMGDIAQFNVFNTNIGRLKALRGRSDYQNRQINQSIAKEAFRKANAIITILTNNFTV